MPPKTKRRAHAQRVAANYAVTLSLDSEMFRTSTQSSNHYVCVCVCVCVCGFRSIMSHKIRRLKIKKQGRR